VTGARPIEAKALARRHAARLADPVAQTTRRAIASAYEHLAHKAEAATVASHPQ